MFDSKVVKGAPSLFSLFCSKVLQNKQKFFRSSIYGNFTESGGKALNGGHITLMTKPRSLYNAIFRYVMENQMFSLSEDVVNSGKTIL